MAGQFCAQCGQSATELDRPIHALARDFFDGFFSLDGRFWQTAISLFTSPGSATRGFLDGQRATFTPPFRLYVIAVLVFVLGFQLTGITPLGLASGERQDPQIAQTEAQAGLTAGPLSVYLTLFRPPWEPEPRPLSWEQIRAGAAQLGEAEETFPQTEAEALEGGGLLALAVRVARDPASVERQANLALNQAVLVMVILFAAMNMVFHPHATLITHVIHSLYMHAAALPVIVVAAIASNFALALHAAPSIGLGLLGLVSVLYLLWRSDREVYSSSWWGAGLRVLGLFLLYATFFLFVAIGLILLIVM